MENNKALRRLQLTCPNFFQSSQSQSRISTSSTAGGNTESKGPFAHVKAAPLDPILGTKILFDQDNDNRKVNLGIGAYRTDEGKPYVLTSVRKAEQLIAQDKSLDKEYLPINGNVKMAKLAAAMLFGKDCTAVVEDRIASVQTLSGTGALRVGSEFLAATFPNATLFLSEPSWENHKNIFNKCRIPFQSYRYWDAKNRRLDFEGMLADLRAAPPKSIILLHACAHNPTGVDPTMDQWKAIAAVMKEREHFPFFDSAYQGFASGDLVQDAAAIRYFIDEGFQMLVCQSFAKNFGLYNERIGCLHAICGSKQNAAAVLSQINTHIRPNYSNPPSHGAHIISTILGKPEITKEWETEMKGMAERIKRMRTLLFEELKRLGTPGDWSHIVSQIGMFSYTGLTPAQCEQMIKKHHVYLLKSGRISMAGVNNRNVKYIAEAIDDVVRNY